MSKVKRFRNPLKSAHGPYDAPGRSSSSTTPAPSLAIEPSLSLQVPPHAPTSSSVADEVSQQEQAPTQPSYPSAMSIRHHGHSNNPTKHIKIKVNEVNNLHIGERIIVDFDNYDAAYGEAQGLFAGYCGLLAIDGNFFPINFNRWSGPSSIPKKYKEDCFETMLKSRFFFRTTNAIAYRYCNASLNKKWAIHRHRLWDEFYDPAKSRTELLSNVPPGINRDQWAYFVAYRLKSSIIVRL
nr:uncharacterized protein LOC104117601 [Nicotiana tomentosiformis]